MKSTVDQFESVPLREEFTPIPGAELLKSERHTVTLRPDTVAFLKREAKRMKREFAAVLRFAIDYATDKWSEVAELAEPLAFYTLSTRQKAPAAIVVTLDAATARELWVIVAKSPHITVEAIVASQMALLMCDVRAERSNTRAVIHAEIRDSAANYA